VASRQKGTVVVLAGKPSNVSLRVIVPLVISLITEPVTETERVWPFTGGEGATTTLVTWKSSPELPQLV